MGLHGWEVSCACKSCQHTWVSDNRLLGGPLFEIHGPPYIHEDVSWCCRSYRWPRLKNDVLDVASRFLVCQQVKAENTRSGGMLQPLPLPEWMWYCITYDFIMGIPLARRQLDTVRVIIDRLMKSVHFIMIKKMCPLISLTRLYRDRIY